MCCNWVSGRFRSQALSSNASTRVSALALGVTLSALVLVASAVLRAYALRLIAEVQLSRRGLKVFPQVCRGHMWFSKGMGMGDWS